MPIDMTNVKQIMHGEKEVVKIEDSNGHVLWEKKGEERETVTYTTNASSVDTYRTYMYFSGSNINIPNLKSTIASQHGVSVNDVKVESIIFNTKISRNKTGQPYVGFRARASSNPNRGVQYCSSTPIVLDIDFTEDENLFNSNSIGIYGYSGTGSNPNQAFRTNYYWYFYSTASYTHKITITLSYPK